MWKDLLPGLLGGLIAVLLAAVAIRGRRSAGIGRDGFRSLRPGWYLHLALVGCFVMCAVIALFFLGGGSARADADRQHLYAGALGIVFAAAGLWVLWGGYLRQVSWAGDHLRVTAPGRADQLYRFSQLREIGHGLDRADLKLQFEDGRVLRVSGYCHGFDEFMTNMVRHVPPHLADGLGPP